MTHLFEDLFLLDRLDRLIRTKATGNTEELASRLDICKRKAKRLIAMLRAMGLPVAYDKERKTYYYEEEVKIHFEIVVGKDALMRIRGGNENNWKKRFAPPNFGGDALELCTTSPNYGAP